jgi:glutamate-1-semialdehyde 2,1-aminomutase
MSTQSRLSTADVREQLNSYERDAELRERARRVIPGGMYGHQSAAHLPEGFPQFFTRGEGSHVWDADGNEYIDLMCSYGPIVLGHCHPAVERAAAEQRARGDCFTAPTERIVELAELLTRVTPHADWCWFAKNGTDATVYALTVARAHTGKRVVLRAGNAYHGWAPVWQAEDRRGMIAEDTAHQFSYVYNDLDSVREAADRAGDDLAAILTSAFKHDVGHDQELPEPEFLVGVRELCDARGAVLILDDVRAGFRLHLGGSWTALGVEPDISAYSKAIANGYALAAVAARDSLRDAAASIFATGSFWFAGVAMAASIATIKALQTTDALSHMERVGSQLSEGIREQALAHGVPIRYTGPVQMPYLIFEGDEPARFKIPRAKLFTGEAARRGVYLHPSHNWFLSAAHTEEDIRRTLQVTDLAFAKVREDFRGS